MAKKQKHDVLTDSQYEQLGRDLLGTKDDVVEVARKTFGHLWTQEDDEGLFSVADLFQCSGCCDWMRSDEKEGDAEDVCRKCIASDATPEAAARKNGLRVEKLDCKVYRVLRKNDEIGQVIRLGDQLSLSEWIAIPSGVLSIIGVNSIRSSLDQLLWDFGQVHVLLNVRLKNPSKVTRESLRDLANALVEAAQRSLPEALTVEVIDANAHAPMVIERAVVRPPRKKKSEKK